jgi:cobalt/nickel transport system permease protein
VVNHGPLSSIRTLEDWSRSDSWLHRRDPRAKLLSTLFILTALAWMPVRDATSMWLGAAAAIAILCVAAISARLPVFSILARGGVVLPFTGLFALLAWVEGNPQRAISLLAKSWLSAVAVVLLMAATPLERLFAGLEKMGVPPLLVSVVQFVWRYLHVAFAQLGRMQIARAARGGEHRFAFATSTVAVLFASSAARAERVHWALLSRGGEAHFPLLDGLRMRWTDYALLASALVAAILLVISGGLR